MSSVLTSAKIKSWLIFTWHMYKKFIVNNYFYKNRIIWFEGVTDRGVTNQNFETEQYYTSEPDKLKKLYFRV